METKLTETDEREEDVIWTVIEFGDKTNADLNKNCQKCIPYFFDYKPWLTCFIWNVLLWLIINGGLNVFALSIKPP